MSTDSKRLSLDVLDWMWGTVKGSFNEKMDTSQIIVDAVIGMIPLVGDVTAARDLIAVSLGLAGTAPALLLVNETMGAPPS